MARTDPLADAIARLARSGIDVAPVPQPSLEVVQQQEPIRAWRGLRLCAERATVHLAPLNGQYGIFKPEDRAICHAANDYLCRLTYSAYANARYNLPVRHEAPGTNCDCGFYAVKDESGCQGGLHAEVDLYGRVIEHDYGYRAEYQRVMCVVIPRERYCAGGFLCDQPPEMVAWKGDGTMLTTCAEHAASFERAATLGRIASRLGVEVRWAEAVNS